MSQWITPNEAFQRGATVPELNSWSTKGAPALGGRKLRRRPDPMHRGYYRYDADQLNKILSRTVSKAETADGKRRLMTVATAAEKLAVTTTTIYDWNKNGCPPLRGVTLSLVKRPFRGTKPRYFVDALDVDTIVRARATAASRDDPTPLEARAIEEAKRIKEETAVQPFKYQIAEAIGTAANCLAPCRAPHFSAIYDALGHDGKMPPAKPPGRRSRYCRQMQKANEVLDRLDREERRLGHITEIAEKVGVAPGWLAMDQSFRDKYAKLLPKYVHGDCRSLYTDETGQWLPTPLVRGTLHVDSLTLMEWRVRCFWLGGRPIDAKPVPLRTRVLNWRLCWVYAKCDVDAIIAARQPFVYVDSNGRWPSARAALEEFGFVHRRLRTWASSGCRWLAGRALRAQRVKGGAYNWIGDGLIWVFFEDDLRAIEAAILGRPFNAKRDGNGHANQPAPPAAGNGHAIIEAPSPPKKARGGAPRKWQDLADLMGSSPGKTDKEYVALYRKHFGAAISKGHKKSPKESTVRKVRFAYRMGQ